MGFYDSLILLIKRLSIYTATDANPSKEIKLSSHTFLFVKYEIKILVLFGAATY